MAQPHLLEGPHCVPDVDVIHPEANTLGCREQNHLQDTVPHNLDVAQVRLQAFQLLAGERLGRWKGRQQQQATAATAAGRGMMEGRRRWGGGGEEA